MKQVDTAALTIGDKSFSLPVYEDADGEKFLDIRALAKDTGGMVTYDPGFVNTASCASAVSLVDGAKGRLIYRGYRVEELAEHCDFVEAAYLLIHGDLPSAAQRIELAELFNQHSMIHEDMSIFFRNYPEHSHPMAILAAMAVSLSSFYPELQQERQEALDITATRLLSKLRTIAAFSYKKSVGEPFVYPCKRLDYCSNFLNMMFSSPVNDYNIDPVLVKALNRMLVLHADHGQNCSTSAVRLVGSSGVNLYASISAGICALWGGLHGGASQAVIEMLEQISADGGNIDRAISRAQDKNDPFRLMGFGHRVYKSYDPRAKIAKQTCYEVLDHLGIKEELLDLAVELEKKALASTYFQERKLYPNVDFYTGIVYRAMGIPKNMYPVMFAIGRLPGWIAQWLELQNDPEKKIGRPAQAYTGPLDRTVVPLNKRQR